MKVQFQIYHLWDSFGNQWAGVADDGNDTVTPWGLKDSDGESLYFEAEAYHLKKWAEKHGLGFALYDREETIENPKSEFQNSIQ